jgi:hypothetical protein
MQREDHVDTEVSTGRSCAGSNAVWLVIGVKINPLLTLLSPIRAPALVLFGNNQDSCRRAEKRSARLLRESTA